MGWKLDLKNETPTTIDATRPDPGWYRATVEQVYEDPENGSMVFEFKVIGPQFAGSIHKEFLGNPELQSSEKATALAVKKCKSWGSRLGIFKDDDFGGEADVDFTQARGKECVLHLKLDTYMGNDGKQREVTRIDWAPYPLDHEKINAQTRTLLGLPLLPSQSCAATTPAEPAKGGKRGTKPDAIPAGNGVPASVGAIDVSDL